MTSGIAAISSCGRYRYGLTRYVGIPLGFDVDDPRPKMCAFLMLNPSTADATVDDPTIRRCMRFTLDWNYTSLFVINLFAFRATDPEDLKKADDPVGPENEQYVKETADMVANPPPGAPYVGGPVVCAWGNHGTYMGQDKVVLGWLKEIGVQPWYLRITKAGQPAHPLYLPADLKPRPMP